MTSRIPELNHGLNESWSASSAVNQSPSSSPRLVVIAASAGGLRPVMQLLASLPADFPAAIALVKHRGSDEPERLVALLSRATRLNVREALDGALLQSGTVYVCPPQIHMTAEHCIRLVNGPRIRFVRPNADLMLESVARSYADRALGVVLSGTGRDGALGSLALSQAGGFVLAQAEASCEFTEMPEAAVKVGAADQVLSPAEMARALRRWAVTGAIPARTDAERRTAVAARTKVLLVDDHRVVLDGLRILLEGESDMDVVAIADDGQSAVEATHELEPDVVVLDLRMPKVDGVEAARQILSNRPATRVIALSAETNPRAIDQLFTAGAVGYLSKQCAFAELVQAIRAVVAGNAYMSPEVARLVAAGRATAPLPLRVREGANV